MQHVGIRQHDARVAADLRACLPRSVAVVDRRAHSPSQAERRQRPRLVRGERLGRIHVQRPRAQIAAEHVERRQVEAHRLARRGAGRHDDRPFPGLVDRLQLMRVQALDAHRLQRRPHVGVQLRRGGQRPRPARAFARLGDQPSVLAGRVEQRAPRLDLALDGHGLR